jgi:hypothetical protein
MLVVLEPAPSRTLPDSLLPYHAKVRQQNRRCDHA